MKNLNPFFNPHISRMSLQRKYDNHEKISYEDLGLMAEVVIARGNRTEDITLFSKMQQRIQEDEQNTKKEGEV